MRDPVAFLRKIAAATAQREARASDGDAPKHLGSYAQVTVVEKRRPAALLAFLTRK